mmetsp:Transcript_117985/g.328795  ORF Transcript_117985/g.328795 Transcript_117985/m.328795 type:complete len:360 (+) Transcript_117985:75-1154(+)
MGTARTRDGNGRAFYMCNCRYTRNFFVRSAGYHFEFDGDDAAFARQYESLVRDAGDDRPMPPVEEVLRDIRAQLEERQRAPQEALERARTVANKYSRLHPDVYLLDRQRFLTPEFLALSEALRSCPDRPAEINACVQRLVERCVLTPLRPMLFKFSVFTPEFCDLFEGEIAHFEASDAPKARPNTMNRYGVILREIGLCGGLLDPFVSEFVDPLAAKLLPMCADGLDSYRAFTVKYEATDDGDRELAQHYDNSEVTLNVNVGGEWTGGQVTFFGLVGSRPEAPLSVVLERGHGVLHAGRELHQAEAVCTGRRQNLILWCRSSEVRNAECPMCFDPPRVVPTNEYTDEGFTVPPCRLSKS